MDKKDLESFKKVLDHKDKVLSLYPNGHATYLIAHGFNLPDGTLHENYGGPKMSDSERKELEKIQAEAKRQLDEWFALPENRDLEINPLDANEIRIRDHLLATTGYDGGNDPVGALIASHDHFFKSDKE